MMEAGLRIIVRVLYRTVADTRLIHCLRRNYTHIKDVFSYEKPERNCSHSGVSRMFRRNATIRAACCTIVQRLSYQYPH